jgi:hypothetical protein
LSKRRAADHFSDRVHLLDSAQYPRLGHDVFETWIPVIAVKKPDRPAVPTAMAGR